MMHGIDNLSVAICTVGLSGSLAILAAGAERMRALRKKTRSLERIKDSLERRK